MHPNHAFGTDKCLSLRRVHVCSHGRSSPMAKGIGKAERLASNTDYASVAPSTILDVTDTSNVKFRLTMEADEELEIEYGSKSSAVKIIRLGDT